MGIAYIPEDRLQDGFLPKANVAQNLILGYQRQEPYSRGRFLDWGAIYRAARALISEYNIMTPSADAIAANLSGGNIQRLMLARAFSQPKAMSRLCAFEGFFLVKIPLGKSRCLR